MVLGDFSFLLHYVKQFFPQQLCIVSVLKTYFKVIKQYAVYEIISVNKKHI